VRNPSGYHSKGATPKDKANNFGKFIKDFGWSGSWREDPETGDITLVAKRDNEMIEAYWNNPIPWPEVFYSLGGNRIKCRNISMAAKLAQETPNADRARRGFRRAKSASPVANGSGPGKALLNYLEDASEDDIAGALVGDTVTWTSALGGEPQTDRILPKQFKVTANKEGRTIIHFCGDFGFHSVYLDAIVNVS
jgi:hypothetical protein